MQIVLARVTWSLANLNQLRRNKDSDRLSDWIKKIPVFLTRLHCPDERFEIHNERERGLKTNQKKETQNDGERRTYILFIRILFVGANGYNGMSYITGS